MPSQRRRSSVPAWDPDRRRGAPWPRRRRRRCWPPHRSAAPPATRNLLNPPAGQPTPAASGSPEHPHPDITLPPLLPGLLPGLGLKAEDVE
ncbi:hypothetical protein DRB89_35170 [Streptomyces sp. ICC4]|nr:hypothetical protein DRB89_35170 [Streptomyces sp. ICC4]